MARMARARARVMAGFGMAGGGNADRRRRSLIACLNTIVSIRHFAKTSNSEINYD
jgi:hypothetical protein